MESNNLIPLFTDSTWRTIEPPYKKNADFSVSKDGQRAFIQTVPDFGVGKYICSIPIDGGEYYDFSAACKTNRQECDHYVIITQFTENGKSLIREHAKHCVREGEYLIFSDKLDVTEEVKRLEIELWVKGKGASGEWQRPTLVKGKHLPERKVRIAPIHIKWNTDTPNTEEAHFQAYMSAVDSAGKQGSDIIILGEGLYTRDLGLKYSEEARDYTPKILKALGEKAAQYHTYIIYNGKEEDAGHFYNTSFILDRKGKCVGKYRKTHITVMEYEKGLTPGEELPVFDLDFGRLGLLTCYDQFFPETAKMLAKKGAELICIPTAGDDHHACMALAMYCGVYLAVAGMNNENEYGWGATRVVDPLGRLLAHTDENFKAAYAEVDLSKKVRRRWMSTGPALSDVHDDYRYEVNPHCFENESELVG